MSHDPAKAKMFTTTRMTATIGAATSVGGGLLAVIEDGSPVGLAGLIFAFGGVVVPMVQAYLKNQAEERKQRAELAFKELQHRDEVSAREAKERWERHEIADQLQAAIAQIEANRLEAERARKDHDAAIAEMRAQLDYRDGLILKILDLRESTCSATIAGTSADPLAPDDIEAIAEIRRKNGHDARPPASAGDGPDDPA